MAADDLRTRVDARIEAILDGTGEMGLAVARDVAGPPSDRWYSRLLGATADALAPDTSGRGVASAGAAVELLRGYCRLRSELLVQLADDRAHSLTRDPEAALLAGDYLYSAAYSAVGDVPAAAREPTFETLTDLLGTVTAAFATHRFASLAGADHTAFLDGTSGALGAAAARLGATLADADRAQVDAAATVGRGFAVARQVERGLDADPAAASVVPQAVDEGGLRSHAASRHEAALLALDDLAAEGRQAELVALAPARPGDATE